MSGGVSLAAARGPVGLRIFAIGDVHGRLDLLERLHDAIRDDLAQSPPDDWRIVHVGDYIDRGPASKGVLDFLVAAQADDPRVVTLRGNHDEGFLDFLRDPDMAGLFARFGGADTARSYGVEIGFDDGAQFRAGHAALVRAVPAAHVEFLLGLGWSASFGDYFFCHAGIRPNAPLERQTHDDLIWIREDFLGWSGLHPKVIVHGHTPARRPEVRPNRVNVDTGAFKTGLLTAFVIEEGEKRFLFAEEGAGVSPKRAQRPE